MAPVINRRGALLALGGLTAAWAVPTIAFAQAGTPVLAWTPKALTPDEARTLSAACERIVPTTDTPGAVAAGVPQWIDRALAGWAPPSEVAKLKAGLAAIDQQAYTKFSAPFASLPADKQTAVLASLQTEVWFYQLREMTTSGYFTSEIGATKALRYDPVPGAYRGCIPLKEIGRAWAT
jgi:hypothetical protein